MFDDVVFPATMVVVYASDLVLLHTVASEHEAITFLSEKLEEVVPEEKITEHIEKAYEAGTVSFMPHQPDGIRWVVEVEPPYLSDFSEG